MGSALYPSIGPTLNPSIGGFLQQMLLCGTGLRSYRRGGGRGGGTPVLIYYLQLQKAMQLWPRHQQPEEYQIFAISCTSGLKIHIPAGSFLENDYEVM